MNAASNVVLRDFDGTETIYPADQSAPDVISTGDTDSGLLITRSYVKTDTRDSEGRVIYKQQN
jgi:hypothetical protein